MLQRLMKRLVSSSSYPMTMAEGAREKAFDTLAEHGIQAHYYSAAAGCADKELADALRLLGNGGFLMTGAKGALVGEVTKARLTTDERAHEARKRFFLVQQ